MKSNRKYLIRGYIFATEPSVISLLPTPMNPSIAELCIDAKTDMVKS